MTVGLLVETKYVEGAAMGLDAARTHREDALLAFRGLTSSTSPPSAFRSVLERFLAVRPVAFQMKRLGALLVVLRALMGGAATGRHWPA